MWDSKALVAAKPYWDNVFTGTLCSEACSSTVWIIGNRWHLAQVGLRARWRSRTLTRALGTPTGRSWTATSPLWTRRAIVFPVQDVPGEVYGLARHPRQKESLVDKQGHCVPSARRAGRSLRPGTPPTTNPTSLPSPPPLPRPLLPPSFRPSTLRLVFYQEH